MVRRFVFVCFALTISLSAASTANGQPTTVSVIAVGACACPLAMLSNGDVVASACPPDTLHLVGNIFVLAGLPAGWKQIAGTDVGECGQQVCTTDGDLFGGGYGFGGPWHYNGNVFQLAGRNPATVAAFTVNSVATIDGDYLFKMNGAWTFMGNVLGTNGPTAVRRSSWGALKTHYR
jgi:hypothetical protein